MELIKELIKARYPNPEPFWENNKDWCLKLWQEAQKKFKEKLKEVLEGGGTSESLLEDLWELLEDN